MPAMHDFESESLSNDPVHGYISFTAGMRLEDALEKVDKYLDDAAVLGVRNLRIVHGKGEGVLSGAITKFLEESLLVASYGMARPEEGGWGVTMVEMAGQGASDGGVS